MWRQVRNFVLDIRQVAPGVTHCLHWQVAQGASLQNIVFEMTDDENTKQNVSLHECVRDFSC
jgi:glucan 1,3-beta-glucosidase